MVTFETILKFGKYKGLSIERVFMDDPSYIEWCIDNVDGFDMESEEDEIKIRKASGMDKEEYRSQREDYSIDPYEFCF